ncbi:MAG: MFS transporter [Trebonia sp.]
MGTEGKRLMPGQGWVLALTSVASFMVSLDNQVVATALPVIRVHLHASLATLEWTVNAYTLSFAVLLLTGAALGERLGRRRMLAAGTGLFTVASAACALAPNAGALVAARAVQGAGAALVLPLALALLSAGFPPQRRAWAIGIFSAVTGLAVAAGPIVGGAVAQGIAWQVDFLAERPDRRDPYLADPDQAHGKRTGIRRPGSAGPGAGDWWRTWPRLGADPRQQPWLGQPRGHRDTGCRGGARRRFHRLGTEG